MQFPNVEEMDKIEAELIRTVLAGWSPEQRMEGLKPEDVLRSFSPEDVLRGLSPEDRRRLKQLLEQEEDNASREE